MEESILFEQTGTPLGKTETPLEKKQRITCRVSDDIFDMWQKIIEEDKANASKRYYPVQTLEQLIKNEYELRRVFGTNNKK